MECPTCIKGCDCTRQDPGCGHYACWGRGEGAAARCPGAETERAKTQALLAEMLPAGRR